MSDQDQFVLFADLLGFKGLVLDSKRPDVDELDFRNPPIFMKIGSLSTLYSGIKESNRLSETFNNFHGSIQDTLQQMLWLRPVSVYVFSDSIFVAAPEIADCLGYAERLMNLCVAREAPIRMGVGYGSFIPFGFEFQESPMLKFISSQFLGSGVVQAAVSETCIKGMRIALHDSVVDQVRDKPYASYKLLAIPEVEVLKPKDGTKPEVTHEWNYLGAWQEPLNLYNPAYPKLDNVLVDTLKMHIARMQKATATTPAVHEQYDKTFGALNRMADALSRAEADSQFKAPPPFDLGDLK